VLAAGAFSMAGADWPEDFAFLQAAMHRYGFGRRVRIVHDSIGPLRANTPDGVGVAVVCGTGTAIGARAPDGRIWHTSHWQEFQGSHELARKALRAVYRAELGIDPATSLTARALELFERRTVEELLHLFTGREGTPPRDADRLAPALLEEARSGDDTALRLVRAHGEGLGDYALVAARRVGLDDAPFTLLLAGSVLRDEVSPLADAIVSRVRAWSPEVRVVRSRLEPVAGALLLALDEAAVAVDGEVVRRLAGTLPPPAFFAT
jgi:N-acetylglucosamine kinase-like BadF-type ATPase